MGAGPKEKGLGLGLWVATSQISGRFTGNWVQGLGLLGGKGARDPYSGLSVIPSHTVVSISSFIPPLPDNSQQDISYKRSSTVRGVESCLPGSS